MNEVSILITLATVHFIALMSPGPDFALIVQNTSHHGRKTGLTIAAGLSAGILVHSILSITGISYLVQQHPTLFSVVQILGGSYLLYLGFGALKGLYQAKKHPAGASASNKASRVLSNQKQAFSKGFMTNILNPKALVFFISLMSSLVPASMSVGGKASAVFILWFLALFWFSLLAWLLSTKRLQRKLEASAHYIDGICGVVFTLIGCAILWQAISHL
ncbi:LysE family translocator [Vibrio sp. S11_S32]|uniref:LysE family translocator n=1 Tax=Vibrio sp. S11_S32 TaxID=2720225 RepID=UPI0016819554|nr:LysE family translocator [Vibrio sp. S11_S32]MBD1576041.1 LysE family translocator [Vibrio sp. S11_S32]